MLTSVDFVSLFIYPAINPALSSRQFFTNLDTFHHFQGGQVVNAVFDNSGNVVNYSTNTSGQGMVQQRVIVAGGVQQRGGQQSKAAGKAMKDPNAPKKPLSAYFLFSQVKASLSFAVNNN